MPNIKTNIRGIVRNTPDSDTDMGSAQEIINMRHKDGAWRPIGKKKRLTGSVQVSNNNKQIGWYHHPSNVDSTVISFDTVTKKILVHDTLLGSNVIVKKRDGSDFVLPSGEDFNCFTHLENILVLLGTVDRYNFLWINGAFEFIEIDNVDWTLTKGNVIHEGLTSGVVVCEVHNDRIEETFTSLVPIIIGKYLERRSNDIDNGKIEGITAFRLAIELFDGSFSWYSEIKLLRALGTPFIEANFDVPYYPQNIYETNLHARFGYLEGETEGNADMLMNYSSYLPIIQYQVNESIKYYMRNKIIKAIHVCATKPLYPITSTLVADYYTAQTLNGDGIISNRYYGIKQDPSLPSLNFINDSNEFRSIFSTTVENNFKTPSVSEVYAFKNFESNFLIPVDNFTGNKTSAKHSFIYNKRLHLQQISNSIVRIPPLSPEYPVLGSTTVYSITADYMAYLDIVLEINGSLVVVRKLIDFDLRETFINSGFIIMGRHLYYPHSSAKYLRISFTKNGTDFFKLKNYNGVDMVQIASMNLSKAFTEANALTNNGIKFDYSDAVTNDFNKEWWQYNQLRYIRIQVPVSGVDYATHNSCELCTELPATYIDTNRIQLSETSNPLVLPATNSYRFGDINNEVNGVEVTHEQLSETRFGEYPLYVFTKQGVFALLSGSGSIVYASLDYLKKHKVTDNKTIINVKDYALFRTDKGFFVVAGRDFQELSTPVSGSYTIDIQNDTKFQSLLDGFLSDSHNHLSISNMIDNDDFIACHEHIEDELWLSLTNSIDASYVFNFKTKSWFKSAETFQYFVNLSPDVIGIKESVVSNVYKYDFYDMHSEDNFADLKLFVSRPITFGSTYYKRIEHFVSRLRMEQSGNTILSTKFYLYGSINGFEYKLLQGGEISDNSLQDQEIRRCFVDFKYLIIVIGFNHEYCELVGFESEVKEKFKTKLR